MREPQQYQQFKSRNSGISVMDTIPWGSHILHFFKTQSDLLDVVIPFIKTGLEQNDMCIWIISKPLTIKKSKELLKVVIPTVEEHLISGQLKLCTDAEIYYPDGTFNYRTVLSNIIQLEHKVFENNFDGLRLAGTCLWLHKHQWKDFIEYEKKVNKVINERKIIAICSYPFDRCNLSDFIDATIHHQLVLIRVKGEWQSFLTHQELVKQLKKEEKKYIQLLESEVSLQTEEVKKLLKQKDDFIFQLGHDLRNPLGPLLNLLPILTKNEYDSKKKEIIEILLRNTNYMKKLVNKTLKLAQLDSPTYILHLDTIFPYDILNNIVERDKNKMNSNCIITNNIPKDLNVLADEVPFSEVLENLIHNSIKYSAKNGKIIINAKKKIDSIEFSISDNGIGIAKDQLPFIFNEFYKANGARHDFNSSGLGLPICKRIIEKHGGKIWAESQGLSKGSTFYFTIPFISKSISTTINSK